MLLAYVVCFLFFACVAMTINEGLWNNAITLFSNLLAGVLAIFMGVPVGTYLAEVSGKGAENAWYFVFAGVWVIFAISALIIRLVADRSSRVKMRFIGPIDKAAGPLMGLLVSVMFTSFATYTLDRIPIQAGQWKYADASGWQKSVFQYGRAPFLNVINSIAKSEQVNSPLLQE